MIPSFFRLFNINSPIQPIWVPPNCRFEVDDLEKEWTYKPNHFDFIFARCIAQAITDWPAVMKQAYKYLPPLFWQPLADAV
jgi:hypothetical protein